MKLKNLLMGAAVSSPPCGFYGVLLSPRLKPSYRVHLLKFLRTQPGIFLEDRREV